MNKQKPGMGIEWTRHWLGHGLLFVTIWAILLLLPDRIGLPLAIPLFLLWTYHAVSQPRLTRPRDSDILPE